MTAEKKQMHIVDARDAFRKWNACQFEKRFNQDVGAIQYVRLIPLFFQLNNKLLPGYNDINAPAGVYGYVPDSKIIQKAKSLNNRFRYQQESAIKNYAIESVFYNEKLVNNKCSCWVFYRHTLNKSQIKLLKDKAKKIEKWFVSRELNLVVNFLSLEDFNKNRRSVIPYKNKSVYLDEFYSESILLAGKYPAWWLVPPEKEGEYNASIQYIKEHRFVDEEEYIDLGGINEFEQKDLIYSVNNWVKLSYKKPEVSLAMLLIMDIKNAAWPNIDGISVRLKKEIYRGAKDVDVILIFAKMMKESFSELSQNNKKLSPVRVFAQLKNNNVELNKSIIEHFLSDEYVYESTPHGIKKIISYLNLYKTISSYIRQVYQRIFSLYKESSLAKDNNNAGKVGQEAANEADSMLSYLSSNESKISLYNNKNNTDIILDRIHLKQSLSHNRESWSLILSSPEGEETQVEGFNSLLGLLAWCWLNRIINESTQVSVESISRSVKQVEAYYVLETLLQALDYMLITAIPTGALDAEVKPVRSIVFVSLKEVLDVEHELTDISVDPFGVNYALNNTSLKCEQLIVNSWGELHEKLYFGESGVLNCICEWTHHAPLSALSKPKDLKIFGYGDGSSTHIALRIMQIYEDMKEYFYYDKQHQGRYIIRMGTEFYSIVNKDGLLTPFELGGKNKILNYLEEPLNVYQSTAIEKMAFLASPLREIYRHNKENIIQVFFQVINRSCHTWVLDEKGSLWSDVISVYERDSYLMQWLYLLKNIRKRYFSDIEKDKEFFPLEIDQLSINQLGGIDFVLMGVEAFTGNKNFIEIKVSVVTNDEGENLNLQCDGVNFSYAEYRDNVMLECVQYIQAKMQGEGRKSIYVTDIDLPLSRLDVGENEDIQVSHVLKFKRNIEHKINKMLDG